MIRNIVFDMGGVIIEWNPKKLSQDIDLEMAEVIQKYLFSSPIWLKLDAGDLSLEDGLKEILEQSPSKYHTQLTKAYNQWHEYIVIKPDTEQLIKELKLKGYSLYMLSNCSVAFNIYHVKHRVFSYFAGHYISAEHHLMKPEKEIYCDFLDTYGLKAEECLFIDDVLANVEGARSVGMQVYHFKDDTKELKEMLL